MTIAKAPSLVGTPTIFAGFEVDDLGITGIPPNLTPDHITTGMREATKRDTKYRFIKADLLRIATLEFGDEDAAQWFDTAYFGSPQTARNYRYIGRRISHDMRIPDVLWSHYALVAAGWISDIERRALIKIVVADGCVESVAWLREMVANLWRRKYGNLPYTSQNAMDPEGALATFDEAAWKEAQAQDPPRVRLNGCLLQARALAKRQALLEGGAWERMETYLDHMASIIEELNA